MAFREFQAFVCFAALACAQQSSNLAAPATTPKDLALISGRTLDADGRPLRKSMLTLRPMVTKMGEISTPYATTSDAQGDFSFDGVEPGKYTLVAMHPGYLQQEYGAKKATNRGTILNLTAGQRMSDLNLTLSPQAVISGRVVDDEGDPVDNAQVRVMRSMYMNGKRQLVPASNAASNEVGEFRVTGLAAGRYFLNAIPQSSRFRRTRRAANGSDAGKPDEDFVTTYYPGVADAASSAPLEVAAGQNLAGMDIRVRKSPVFHVRGKVALDAPVEPLQRLQVNILPRDPWGVGFGGSPGVLVGKDGSFDLTGVAAGSYTLVAMSENGMRSTVGRMPVEVANGNLEGIVLAMQHASKLQGSLKWEGQTVGPPTRTSLDISTIRVNLMAADGPTHITPNSTVNGDGTFALADVPAGAYRAEVFGLPEGTYLKSVRYENQDVLASGLNVLPGGGSLEIVVSADTGTVEGSIKTEQQQSGAGVMVTMVPDPVVPGQTYLNRAATADQNGRFSFKSVAPGTYRLYAWEDVESGAPFDPDFLKPLENLGVKVTVDPNGRQQISVPLITAVQSGSVQ